MITVPELTRADPGFFDFAIDELSVKDEDVFVLCSRLDKDVKTVQSLNLNHVLVTRRFYERVNSPPPTVFARNLIQVFDFIPKEQEYNFLEEL